MYGQNNKIHGVFLIWNVSDLLALQPYDKNNYRKIAMKIKRLKKKFLSFKIARPAMVPQINRGHFNTPIKIDNTQSISHKPLSAILSKLQKGLIGVLFFASMPGFAVPGFETCTTVTQITTDLPQHIDTTVEPRIKAFNENTTVIAPTPGQRSTFSSLLPVLSSGQCPTSQEISNANSIDYEFMLLIDPVNPAKGVIGLQPRYSVKDHGWGSFFYKVGVAPRSVIEIVHPLNDTFTPDVGARVFHRSAAHAYFIAGAFRRSPWDNSPAGTDSTVHDLGNSGNADPPDLLGSLFNVAHQHASTDSILTIQIHAFGNTTAAKFPDNDIIETVADFNHDSGAVSETNIRPLKAVISTGGARLNPHCVNIEKAIENRVGRAGVFLKGNPAGADNSLVNSVVTTTGQNKIQSGSDYRFLGATYNLHGQETRAGLHGQTGFFCHVELSRDARSPVLNQDAAVVALVEGINAGVNTTRATSKDGLLWSMNREANWHNHDIDYNQDWATLADNVTKTWPDKINHSQSYGYDFTHSSSAVPLTTRRIFSNRQAGASESVCEVPGTVNLNFLPTYDDNAAKAWNLTKPNNYPVGWNFSIQSDKTLSSSSSEGGVSARVVSNKKAVFGLVDSSAAFSQGTEVKYGFLFEATGQWKIYTDGIALTQSDSQGRLPNGSYSSGDQFIVSRDGSNYIFRQERQSAPGIFDEVYRLTGSIVSLRLHAAVHDSGGQLKAVRASFATDISSLRSGSLSQISKPPGLANGWNYGIQSSQYAPANTNAKISAKISAARTSSIFGFENRSDSLHKIKSINYGFRFFSGGTWKIYVNGAEAVPLTDEDGLPIEVTSGTYSVGDEFRIERKGSIYTFRKGTSFIYSTNGSSSLQLKLHAAIYSGSGGFKDLFASFADGPLLLMAGSDQPNIDRVPRRLHVDGLYVFKNGDVAFSLSQDYRAGMANYDQCSSCVVMKNGAVFRYHRSGTYAGKITRILREGSATDGLSSSEDNIDGLHIAESATGGIDAMFISYTNDGVALLNSAGVPVSYEDGDIIQVTPSTAPLPHSASANWTGELYLSERAYLAEGVNNGNDEDISALTVHNGRAVVSLGSVAALDTDSSFGTSEEETEGAITLTNGLNFSDGATVYIDRDETAADPARAPVANIEMFTEQGEVFSNGTRSNRFHSDIGAAHAYSCPSESLPIANTSVPSSGTHVVVVRTGVPFATLTIDGGATVTTDENGNYIFWDVPSEQTFRVEVSNSNVQGCFSPASIDVTTTGTVGDVVFSLLPSCGPPLDAKDKLIEAWGITPGPRFDQWINDVFLYAANTGWAFNGYPNVFKHVNEDLIFTGMSSKSYGSVIVIFSDENKYAKAMAWYAPDLEDDISKPISGILPFTSKIPIKPGTMGTVGVDDTGNFISRTFDLFSMDDSSAPVLWDVLQNKEADIDPNSPHPEHPWSNPIKTLEDSHVIRDMANDRRKRRNSWCDWNSCKAGTEWFPQGGVALDPNDIYPAGYSDSSGAGDIFIPSSDFGVDGCTPYSFSCKTFKLWPSGSNNQNYRSLEVVVDWPGIVTADSVHAEWIRFNLPSNWVDTALEFGGNILLSFAVEGLFTEIAGVSLANSISTAFSFRIFTLALLNGDTVEVAFSKGIGRVVAANLGQVILGSAGVGSVGFGDFKLAVDGTELALPIEFVTESVVPKLIYMIKSTWEDPVQNGLANYSVRTLITQEAVDSLLAPNANVSNAFLKLIVMESTPIANCTVVVDTDETDGVDTNQDCKLRTAVVVSEEALQAAIDASSVLITTSNNEPKQPKMKTMEPRFEGNNLILTANLFGVSNTNLNVSFYIDGKLIGNKIGAPYELAWSNPTPGNHILQTISFDQQSNFVELSDYDWFVVP